MFDDDTRPPTPEALRQQYRALVGLSPEKLANIVIARELEARAARNRVKAALGHLETIKQRVEAFGDTLEDCKPRFAMGVAYDIANDLKQVCELIRKPNGKET